MNTRSLRPRTMCGLPWQLTVSLTVVLSGVALSSCDVREAALDGKIARSGAATLDDTRAVKRAVTEALPDVTFVFRRDGRELRRLSLQRLAEHSKVEIVETDDPYYRDRKSFRAIKLAPALAHAFGQDVATLRRASFLLKAKDGYAVPVEGARLFEEGAYIAFDDVDVPGFAPIGPQKVSPAPAYLVWTRSGQDDLEAYPRPWQLATFEIASFDTLYPHTIPTGEPAQGPALHGLGVFRDHCIKCHAINREGGRVGPDLNVPQSIVEYRPEAQIRAYIKDPSAFRYGAMPAHPQLSSEDLDGLIAYFRAMAVRKHDPDASDVKAAP